MPRSLLLLRVADAATGHLAIDGGCSSPEFLLGRRTAELHVALSRIDDPAFAPEAVDGVAVATEERRVRDGVGRTIVLLQENETRLPASLQIALPATLGRLRGLRARADGFREERSTWRIRVHGDFHLGQTLRTLDDDWSLIDFEGEPARPVAERRQKTSALKDVAGMLRSFAYARGTVEQSLNLAEHQNLLPRLAAWELQARQDFLEGYRGGVGDAPMQLVPTADDAFTRALAAWELDKALYEVAYEVRNRPDWIALPLRSLRSDPGQ